MLSKVDYSPHINDVFFANILPLPIGYSSCPADSLIQLNNESNIDYVLMHSSCSGLAVSGFRFSPESLEHVIYISGESSPVTPDPIFYDAKMSVYSAMNSNMEQLNQFIAILRPDNGFAVSTGFWSDGKVEAHIPEAAFSLLSTFFTAPLHVNTNGITMSAEATLFEKFDAQFMGYVPLGYTWNDFLFQLNGVFKTGPSSFVDGVQSYIYDHAEAKVALATKRVSNAEAVKSKTLQLIEDYTDIVANKQTELQKLQNEYTSIVNKISTVNSTVQQAQNELDLANEEVLAAVGKVTAVCEYADCDEVCLPLPSLSSCDTQLTNDEWGISKVTTLDQILQKKFDTVTENKWHNDYTCRIITNIRGWAETTFGQVCSYKSIIGDVASEKWFTYYDWVNVSHIQPLVIDTHMYSISQTCSQEDSCGTKLQNIECTYLNVGCQLAQQPAIDALTEAQKALIKPMQLLNQAKTNLTIAVAELAAISTKIDSAHIIQELLEDAPDSVTQDLLPNLQSAQESIINLGLSSNLNINNAPSKTAGIYNIILLLESTNYWCAGLPVITIHPDSNTHVKINSDFSLVCEAESELDISYSWKKDGFIIPGSKNNNLTISNTVLQNEGQYQCFVSNAVGTVESMFANVVVYTVPEITLSPSRQEVFEGSDNGGVFICNATAHPSPGFEWQFSSDGGDSWSSINSSSNELIVVKPTQNQEGWYRCKAFLGSDEAYSESAFLKVYAAAISHLSFPVDFYMSVLSTFPEITDSYIKGLKTS